MSLCLSDLSLLLKNRQSEKTREKPSQPLVISTES